MARRGRYILTAKRRAALRKAQLASARARKRSASVSRKKKIAAGVTVGVLGAGVARHKLSGSKLSGRIAPGTSAFTGKTLKGSGPRIHSNPGVDLYGRRYRSNTVSTGRRNGGRSGILTYEHRALFGNKTKDIVPRYKAPDTPNMSNSINYQISQSAEKQAIVKGKTPPGGNASSRIVLTWAFGSEYNMAKNRQLLRKNSKPITRWASSSLGPTARRIMNELNGKDYRVKYR